MTASVLRKVFSIKIEYKGVEKEQYSHVNMANQTFYFQNLKK